MSELPPDFLCTDVSSALDEALYGTAVHATTWFLLEYRESWAAKAPADNNLPGSVHRWLEAQIATVPNGRLQFIRQGKNRQAPLAFFIAAASEKTPRLYHFELDSYDDLLSLDIMAVLAKNDHGTNHHTTQPLVLVCTHGRRDRCCALLGLPILNRLQEALGTAVWQTTHLGGHRFAPTVLSLPAGLSYGRLTLDDIPPLLKSFTHHTLLLEKLRGRTCYRPIEQVADYWLRQETGKRNLENYRHLRTEAVASHRWQVEFSEPDSDQYHRLTIDMDSTPLRLYASSGSYKLKEIPQYIFVAHETTNLNQTKKKEKDTDSKFE